MKKTKKHNSKSKYSKYDDGGKIGSEVGSMLGNLLIPGIGGSIGGMIGGAFDKPEEQEELPLINPTVNPNKFGNQFRKGGKLKYPDGGKIKYEAPVVNFGQVQDNLKSILPNSSQINKSIELDVNNNLVNKYNKIGEINQAEPNKNIVQRTWDIASHPITAASTALNHQDLPEHFTRGEKNVLDNATDIINPIAWLNNVKEVPKNVMDGNYGSAVMNSLYAIPLYQSTKLIPKIGNKLLESKLSNKILDTINPNAQNEINKGVNWLDDYYSNPNTLEKYNKLQNISNNNSNKIYPENTVKVSDKYGDMRINIDKGTINIAKGANKKSLFEYKENLDNSKIQLTTNNKILGDNNLSVKGINYNDGNTFINKISKNKPSVTVHEGTHQMFGRNYTEKEIEMLRSPFRNSKNKYEGYLTKPQEVHARMNEIRYNLGLKPEDKFTSDMISKIKTKTPGVKELLNMIQDKDKFSKLMNDFYSVSGTTIGSKIVSDNLDQKKSHKSGGWLNKYIN